MRRFTFWINLTLLAALLIPVSGCYYHRSGYYEPYHDRYHDHFYHDHHR